MTRLLRLPAAGALLAALLVAGPARADDDCRGWIGPQQAVGIARHTGLVWVRKVTCDDDTWEIEGRDAWGRKMEVEVDSRSGRIRKVEYDD